MATQIDERMIKTYQYKQMLGKITGLLGQYTIPNDMMGLEKQYNMLERMYKELMLEGGDKRRHNRGSREERLPNGCSLRQKLCLPNKIKKEYHEIILHKRNDTYVCVRTNKIYKTLHQANEAHYEECGKVWTKDDELKNPRHKVGKAKNAVSAWGNGSNGQAFYALRANTTDQYDVPIIDVNDDDWYNEHIADFAISIPV
jgi:hypothetical protein